MRLYSCCCSHGADADVWNDHVNDSFNDLCTGGTSEGNCTFS